MLTINSEGGEISTTRDKAVDDLLGLLRAHRPEIVYKWALAIKAMSNTGYASRPFYELRTSASHLVGAVIEVVERGNFTKLRRSITAIGRQEVSRGFHLSEVQGALMRFKEALWPFVVEEFKGNTDGLVNAVQRLDLAVDLGLLEYADFYQQHLASLVEDHVREIEEANQRLQHLAIRDGLTGIYNHNHFHTELAAEVERARRYRRALSLIMMDIDHFKVFNDTFGHPAGDQALKRMAQILCSFIRETDINGRCGGEEFGLILPETEKVGAVIAAERIRSHVEDTIFGDREDSEAKLTISQGVATFPIDASTPSDLLQVADNALYKAKALGRNQVAAA